VISNTIAIRMGILLGSRRVTTPSGMEWRVARRWSSRRLPRWRRVKLGEGAERTADVAWSIPPLDIGGLEDLEALIAVVAVAAILVLVVIPLLLFGIELIVLGLLVAAGIVARSMLGRPWVVQATPSGDSAGALAWEIKGWRRSSQLIESVSSELASGLTPSPAESGDG